MAIITKFCPEYVEQKSIKILLTVQSFYVVHSYL